MLLVYPVNGYESCMTQILISKMGGEEGTKEKRCTNAAARSSQLNWAWRCTRAQQGSTPSFTPQNRVFFSSFKCHFRSHFLFSSFSSLFLVSAINTILWFSFQHVVVNTSSLKLVLLSRPRFKARREKFNWAPSFFSPLFHFLSLSLFLFGLFLFW